jgi:pectate lyase
VSAGAGGAGGAAAGSGGAPALGACAAWPEAKSSQAVSAKIAVSGTYDGMLKRYTGSGALGSGNQDEGQDPLFELADGATLKNVIVGSPAADGIHCKGTCRLENVWWEDVGEDAATLLGSNPSQVMTISCGGARNAEDKVFQHNGPGTMRIEHFQAETFGKLYRSCGNCSSQYGRHVEFSDVTATSGGVIAGINTNYEDTAKFENITIHDPAMKTKICDRFTGNNSGAEPTKTGTGMDATHCLYQASDIHWVN